jgi:prepilin-type N-terminal cleavage/methylation domain-containing protein
MIMTPAGLARLKWRRAAVPLERSKRPGARLRAGARLQAGESGFTLIEVLIASVLALLVLGATLSLFVTGQVDATSAVARADAVQVANDGLREMDQDLRLAYEVQNPTSTSLTGCTLSNGIENCSIIDVLARTGSGTDYEVRYNCSSLHSTTVPADYSCWRYQCSASAATLPTSPQCLTGTVSSKMIIDDVINGASATTPVFSFSWPSGTTRPTTGTVTIDVPAAGTLSKASNGDPATVLLSDGIFMPNLSYGQ